MDYSRIYTNTYTPNRKELRFGTVSVPVTHHRRKPMGYELFEHVGSPMPPTFVNGLAYTRGSAEWEANRPYGKAYDRFFNAAHGGKKAALAITLFEWRSSLGMITDGARAMAASIRALRRGNLYEAVRELGVRKRNYHLRLRKQVDKGVSPSNLWLEMNFGWLPLIEDIAAACNALSQAIPVHPVKGRAWEAIDYSFRDVSPWGDAHRGSVIGRSQCQLLGDVVGVNPNLNLARQLGLINPASVAWDAIPFSFVVDWFLPVGKFLSRFDSQVGVEVGNLIMSRKVECYGQELYEINSRVPPESLSFRSTFKLFRRETMGRFPLPDFTIPALQGDLWRATTSVALVNQQLNALLHTKWR